MKKSSILIAILIISILLISGCGGKREATHKERLISVEDKYYLTENNTISVVTDEFHFKGTPNPHAYLSGEWLETSETYGFIAKFNISEIKNVENAILNLKVEAYTHKLISKENCDVTKLFYIKNITEPWDPETLDYETLKQLEETGEIVGDFTITPAVQKGEYISIDFPVKELMSGYGFTFVQEDESLCRIAFYSQMNKKEHQPYITVEKFLPVQGDVSDEELYGKIPSGRIPDDESSVIPDKNPNDPNNKPSIKGAKGELIGLISQRSGFSANYKQTTSSIVTGDDIGFGTGEIEGESTVYEKGDNIKIESSTMGTKVTLLMIGKKVTQCTEMEGIPSMCIDTEIPVTSRIDHALINDPDKYTVTTLKSRTVLGESLSCYLVEGMERDMSFSIERCLNSQGIPLYGEVHTSGPMGSTDGTMIAISYNERVSDDIFTIDKSGASVSITPDMSDAELEQAYEDLLDQLMEDLE